METSPPESDWETSNNQHSTLNIEGCPARPSLRRWAFDVQYSMFSLIIYLRALARIQSFISIPSRLRAAGIQT
jgi:hypothetical protein